MSPTCRNGRNNDNVKSKILDHSLIACSLLVDFKKYRSLVGMEMSLDHQPIWL